MKIKHASSSLVEGFRGLFVLWAVIIGVLVLDQLTKNLVLSSMNPNESIPILQGVFHLTYVQNTGIAFGLFQNANLLFGVLSALIIAGIVLYLPHIKKEGRAMHAAFGLLLGGALGNLIDRIYLGFVVDFLDFRVWPVFNVADSSVCIAIALLLLLTWKK